MNVNHDFKNYPCYLARKLKYVCIILYWGGGPECNNCAWNDFVVKWQFSCEDEDNTVYWYEMSKHIDYADSALYYETWPVKYLG